MEKTGCQCAVVIHIKRTHLNGGEDPSVLNSLIIEAAMTLTAEEAVLLSQQLTTARTLEN